MCVCVQRRASVGGARVGVASDGGRENALKTALLAPPVFREHLLTHASAPPTPPRDQAARLASTAASGIHRRVDHEGNELNCITKPLLHRRHETSTYPPTLAKTYITVEDFFLPIARC